MSRKSKPTDNIGRKFRIFVKPIGEDGYPDESRFGWVACLGDGTIGTSLKRKEVIVFEEREDGHGSFSDWKRLLEEDHPDWRILNGPSYLS